MILDIIRVKNLVRALLDYVKSDYRNHEESETWLYKVLYGNRDGDYDFYQQGREIFLRGDRDPHNLSVQLELPKDISNFPCIVVREPSRMNNNSQNTIGKLTGSVYGESVQRGEVIDAKSFKYELMCISDNVLTSILISEVLYSLLLGAFNQLGGEYNNVSFDMKELISENNLVPYPIIFRSISLSIDSHYTVPTIDSSDFATKVFFEPPQFY